jgi:hypothetical protein
VSWMRSKQSEEFPEPEGATPEWGDILSSIRADLRPARMPGRIVPLAEPIDPLSTDHLHPPTHYQNLI